MTTGTTTTEWQARWVWPTGTRVAVQFKEGTKTGIVTKQNNVSVWIRFDDGTERKNVSKTYIGLTRTAATMTKRDGLFVIEKHWDGNVCETEGRNGRTYVSNGRWQWVVIVDGETDSAYDTKREAVSRIADLERMAR